MKRLFLAASLFVSSLFGAAATDSAPTKLYIVIHGTWGHESSWYLPEGDFFKTLEKQLAPAHVISFTWSGRNSHQSRLTAGKSLANLLQGYKKLNPEIEFYIISHSHGGTVAALATQFLGVDTDPDNLSKKRYVKAMFNLGTPVDKDRYLPNYDIVDYVINLFSFNDLVQTVWGHCKREYPTQEHTANLRTKINGKDPDHCNMHSNLIAHWIPTILTQLTQEQMPSWNPFLEPTIINITADQEPTYRKDHWRAIDIKLDEGIQHYRGTGINSTWETFFRVLFGYPPQAFEENPKPANLPWSKKFKQIMISLQQAIKETADTFFSPFYD